MDTQYILISNYKTVLQNKGVFVKVKNKGAGIPH